MLAKPEEFRAVEEALKAMGVLDKFEKENGPVLGRAMITLTEIPESIPVQREDRENLTAFEISEGATLTIIDSSEWEWEENRSNPSGPTSARRVRPSSRR